MDGEKEKREKELGVHLRESKVSGRVETLTRGPAKGVERGGCSPAFILSVRQDDDD